jgi:hypothetical protein
MTQSHLVMEDPRALAGKLDAVGWGLFFTWLGIAFLADVGWGWGLLGVGVIALSEQMARKYFGLPIQGFGLITGTVFVLWGLWELLEIELGGGFLPVLLIVIGIGIVASALLRKPQVR